jgi:hypothetical protein
MFAEPTTVMAGAAALARAPLRRLVDAAGYSADAEHAQALGAGRQRSAGAGVDSDQVVGVERNPLTVQIHRPRAAQRDVELLLPGFGLIV